MYRLDNANDLKPTGLWAPLVKHLQDSDPDDVFRELTADNRY